MESNTSRKKGNFADRQKGPTEAFENLMKRISLDLYSVYDHTKSVSPCSMTQRIVRELASGSPSQWVSILSRPSDSLSTAGKKHVMRKLHSHALNGWWSRMQVFVGLELELEPWPEAWSLSWNCANNTQPNSDEFCDGPNRVLIMEIPLETLL